MKAHTPAWHVASLCLAMLVSSAAHARVVGKLQALTQATVRLEVTNG